MKIAKQLPKPEVSVFKGKKEGEYHMVALKPMEIAKLHFKNGKWTTPDGMLFRTNKEAMRHVLYTTEDKSLMNALLPTLGPVSSVKKAKEKEVPAEENKDKLVFDNKKDALEFLFEQPELVDFLLKKMDSVTKPSVDNVNNVKKLEKRAGGAATK